MFFRIFQRQNSIKFSINLPCFIYSTTQNYSTVALWVWGRTVLSGTLYVLRPPLHYMTVWDCQYRCFDVEAVLQCGWRGVICYFICCLQGYVFESSGGAGGWVGRSLIRQVSRKINQVLLHRLFKHRLPFHCVTVTLAIMNVQHLVLLKKIKLIEKQFSWRWPFGDVMVTKRQHFLIHLQIYDKPDDLNPTHEMTCLLHLDWWEINRKTSYWQLHIHHWHWNEPPSDVVAVRRATSSLNHPQTNLTPQHHVAYSC